MDHPLLIITVADDKSSITVDNPGFERSAKFVVSSANELKETFFPSPDKIAGIWKRAHSLDGTEYFSILELSKNSLKYNGQEEAIEIQSGDG